MFPLHWARGSQGKMLIFPSHFTIYPVYPNWRRIQTKVPWGSVSETQPVISGVTLACPVNYLACLLLLLKRRLSFKQSDPEPLTRQKSSEQDVPAAMPCVIASPRSPSALSLLTLSRIVPSLATRTGALAIPVQTPSFQPPMCLCFISNTCASLCTHI